MVLKKEKKKDVFAGFGVDTAIREDEDNFNRREEEEIRASVSSEYVNGSVFAEFDENVRKEKKRMQKEDAKKKKKAAKKEAEGASGSPRGGGVSSSLRGFSQSLRGEVASSLRGEGTSSLRGLGGLLPSSVRGEGTSSLRGLGGLFLRSPSARTLSKGSDDNDRRHPSRRGNGEIDSDIAMGNGEESTASKRHRSQSKKKKQENKNSSRSGTTIIASIPEEDEEYDVDEYEEVVSLDDDESDVEEGEISDDDDDDDSFIGGNSPDKRRKSSVITRSSTGIPIGGMVTSSTTGDSSSSAQHSDYHWISPHSADTIFSGFDIDSIVKDYEKLHRKINFGSNMGGKNNNGLDDIEEEDNNEQILGIRVRYRNLVNLWLDNFPRSNCILFQILVPWAGIILITFYLGKFLAKFEKTDEINANDAIAIMQNSYDLNVNPYEKNLRTMFERPTICFDHYLDKKNNNISNITSTNETIIDLDSISLLSTLAGQDFPNVSLGFDSNPEKTFSEIESYMKICMDAGTEILEKFIDFTAKELEAASQDTMTFNWIRCWDNNTLGDVNPFYPTDAQLKAASEQEEFYFESWKLDQTRLYEKYNESCTNDSCQQEAYNNSVNNATGATMCDINKGASAWFWFVVMTTVGYGNVSPVSTYGRLLVVAFGWITIIIWAILLFIAGRVLGIVIDDLFRRCNCRVMTRNLPSVIIWFSMSIVWIAFVSEHYLHWNNYTDNPDAKSSRWQLTTFRNGMNGTDGELTATEAYWFAYISLLTVGLGDFSLNPETFFLTDMLSWSMSFLVGFTFLSTFLGQIADLMNSFFPDSAIKLKERLLNTNVVGRKEVQYKKENEKRIERLEKLVEIMDDDDVELITQRVARIREKKNVLIHLLYQTKIELEHYKKRGERYDSISYPMVCQEENMLNEVITNTRIEREKLETYRDGRADSSEGLSLPTSGSIHSYVDDGEPQLLMGIKLKLRKGRKSAKEKLKASMYI